MSSSVTLNDWRTIKLGEITTSYAGGTPLRTNPEYYSGGTVPWIKSGEVNKKYIFTCEERITEKAVKESSAKLFSSGSVLVAMYGATAGQTAICKIDASANQAVLAVNSKDKETTNEYIYYLLSFLAPIILLRSQGSGQPNLSKQILEEQELALPPLVEQKKIAEILTSVDRVIELTSMEIEKLKDLKKGMMQELLTKGIGHTKFKDSPVGKIPESWEVIELKDLADKISDGLHSTPEYVERSEYFFVNGNNLKEGKIQLSNNTKYVSRDEYDQHKKDLGDNTILMSINGTIGSLAFYNNEKIVLGKSAAYVNLKPHINKDFIYYLLLSENTQKYFISELTGTTIMNLSLKSIKITPLVAPPKQEQEEISNILKSLDLNIENLNMKLKTIENLKKGLMNDLLTGKVRVKV